MLEAFLSKKEGRKRKNIKRGRGKKQFHKIITGGEVYLFAGVLAKFGRNTDLVANLKEEGCWKVNTFHST